MKRASFKLTSRFVTYLEIWSKLVEASGDYFEKSIEQVPVIDSKTRRYKFKHPASARKRYRDKSEQLNQMIKEVEERLELERGV